ncbi:hypothetical protein MSAN_00303100 [Mycena sanguinolenta]|uniref:Uncharacterized protein n=1 Tax=Mycena sanguinolenta TaxID=230812 RepID=A0A8H6ZEK9_9AGAR|nr:hypothetical protein MSAN_00303100 [Mycena sanguinolenta]
MDNNTHADEGLHSDSTRDNTGSTSCGGAIFSGSQHFTVAGGTFTNITKNYSAAPAVPADFPRIPMGDIDLQREIRLNKPSGVVSLRRLHSAKIERGMVRMTRTVAMYQGDGAEQEWQRDIAKYIGIRHPNVVQLYGTSSCGNIHAAVFHDDLIPYQQFLDLYQHSHFSTSYIYAYMGSEFEAVGDYFETTFGNHLRDYNCTFFIRRSTGRFCADLVPGETELFYYACEADEMSTQLLEGLDFLAEENSEATIIEALTLDKYHTVMCYQGFSEPHSIMISPSVTVNLSGVFRGTLEDIFDDMVQIAHLPYPELERTGWHISGECLNLGEVIADGWTRFNSYDATTISLSFYPSYNHYWLSQANHIFTTLQISSNFRDYAVLDQLHFMLTVSATEVSDPPIGFLFLCPPEDFQTGEASFKWPQCPASWSLDPSGAVRLTSEDAKILGFPSLRLSTKVSGRSWDASVYAGLRQFHKAKGFNPDSQDIAQHLGHKLYQLSGPFAHIDDERSDNRDNFSQYFTGAEFDDAMNYVHSVPALSHQAMEQVPVSSAFEEIASASTSLLPRNWDASAASDGYGYGYHIQTNPYLSTSDFSSSDFNFNPNFNAYNFDDDSSWFDYPVFSDAVSSGSSLNYQSPMLNDAAQFFPATSLPQFPMSLLAPSSFPITSVVYAPVADAPSEKTKNARRNDLVNIVQGSRTQKAPRRFDIRDSLM